MCSEGRRRGAVKTIAFAIRSVDRWVTLYVFCQRRGLLIGTVIAVATSFGLIVQPNLQEFSSVKYMIRTRFDRDPVNLRLAKSSETEQPYRQFHRV